MISPADQTCSIDLNGSWQFAADPLDQGLSEGWYQPDHVLPSAIRVPAAWNAQGVEFSDPEQRAAWEDQRKGLEDEYRKIGWLGDQPRASGSRTPTPDPAGTSGPSQCLTIGRSTEPSSSSKASSGPR